MSNAANRPFDVHCIVLSKCFVRFTLGTVGDANAVASFLSGHFSVGIVYEGAMQK